MNKKKVLALMAMLTVTAMVTACGGKKEEAAVTETQAVESTVVESTVAETAVAENTEQLIEDNSDVALAESVEETEEEMSVVEKNAEEIKGFICYPDQAIEAAKALEELGFGEIKNIKETDSVSFNVTDENGIVLEMYYGQLRDYYLNIYAEDGTKLWEWEYTDRYENAESERIQKLKDEKKK